jgi:hypothetical protein
VGWLARHRSTVFLRVRPGTERWPGERVISVG